MAKTLDSIVINGEEYNIGGGGSVGDLPISEGTATDSEEEFVFSNNGETEVFAKVTPTGVLAKKFQYLDGSDPFGGIRKSMYILSSDNEVDILNKLLTCIKEGDYDVYWETGTYVFKEVYTYMKNSLQWSWTMELPIGNGCRYFFQNSIIISNQPSGTYTDSRNIFGCRAGGTISWNGSSFIPKNLSYELRDGYLINNGGTYCVHDEMNVNLTYFKHVYHNMRMKYVETADTTYISKCIGGGAGCNGLVIIEDCSFITVEDLEARAQRDAEIDEGTRTGDKHGALDNNVTWHASNQKTAPETMIFFVSNNYFSKGFRVGSVSADKDWHYFVKFTNNSVLSAENIALGTGETIQFNNEKRN